MKKALKVMCLTVLMAGMAYSAHAQRFVQSVYLNGNIPVGGFASDVSSVGNIVPGQNVPLGYTEIGKSAIVGFGAGYRASYRFDVGMGMVAPFVGADFFWNMIKGDLRDDYSNARAKSTPTYFNVPILAGVSYLYNDMPVDITPYLEFGVGADMWFITSEGKCTFPVETNKLSYKPTTAFAFMVGLGSYFGRYVSAGVYYYGMGKHTIEYTKSTYNSLDAASQYAYNNNPVVETRTLGSLVLRIGFHF